MPGLTVRNAEGGCATVVLGGVCTCADFECAMRPFWHPSAIDAAKATVASVLARKRKTNPTDVLLYILLILSAIVRAVKSGKLTCVTTDPEISDRVCSHQL